MKNDKLAAKQIVLLGIGHTNAHIVRKWGMNPFPDTDLTCISDRSIASYSGMLPAVLAGQISPAEMEIDLVRLCESVGANLIVDQVSHVDSDSGEVHFADRTPVPFNVLSVGIGSVPSVSCTEIADDAIVRIKPMQSFLDRLASRIEVAKSTSPHSEALRGVVVGSGVAGIEILLCLAPFLKKLGVHSEQLQLITRSGSILPNVAVSASSRVEREIRRRGYEIRTGTEVVKVDKSRVTLSDGDTIAADFVIWATGATSPPALAGLGIPTDEAGFIRTDATLRADTQATIFAVGDTGSIAGQAIPKAGVYAVRQGPVLWENIRRSLLGRKLQAFRPQSHFLKLINFGNGKAVGEWRGFSFEGSTAYWLKNRIDSKFMEKFQPRVMAVSGEPMQCRGCGCKFGADDLSDAIQPKDGSEAIPLEDASPVGGDDSLGILASTDFFSIPFRDAFLAGRIAAIHAASDLVACGATITEALSNVVIPEGDPKAQRNLLRALTAGANREFNALGGRIVGGHTIVGPRLEAGFTVIGTRLGESPLQKNALRAGDGIFTTKPLGVGVLLASHMRSACHARNYETLVQSMLASQAQYAKIAISLGAIACTDVTGFGLAGHLIEMLESSRKMAQVQLEEIPLLPGAVEAVKSGVESSLIGANIRASRKVQAVDALKETPEYRLLFDPQTCGGLLFGIAAEIEQQFLEAAADENLPAPVKIGVVSDWKSQRKPLVVT